MEPLLHRAADCVAAPAGDDRRLHRLLRRHPPRDQRRPAVPARQPAAAELQVGPDRLPRPRLDGAALRRAGAPPERPAQARRTRRRPASAPAATWTTSWSSASGSAPATRRASRSRSPRRPTTSPASACSTTGRRATCRPGSTSRSARSWPRASPPRVSPWMVTPEALEPFRTAQPPRPEGDPAPLPYLLDEADQRAGAFDDRAGGAAADRADARRRRQPAPPLARQHAPPVLDGRPAGGAPRQQRLLAAPRRPARLRHHLGARRPTATAACSRSPAAGASRSHSRTARRAASSRTATRSSCAPARGADGFVPIGFGECRAVVLPAVSMEH